VSNDLPVVAVAVALVHRRTRWLVARRHPDAHLGGLWEFPGGKCELNETPIEAALRELREECGVEAHPERTLPPLRCVYAESIVHLTPVICRWSRGTATPLHSQECRWVSLAELRRLDMPAANAEIIRELALHA
jgi:mutator protein MutT